MPQRERNPENLGRGQINRQKKKHEKDQKIEVAMSPVGNGDTKNNQTIEPNIMANSLIFFCCCCSNWEDSTLPITQILISLRKFL